MKILLPIATIFLLNLLSACSAQNEKITTNVTEKPAIISSNQVEIDHDLYTATVYDNEQLIVADSKGNKLLEISVEDVESTEFIDFNEDGYADLKLNLTADISGLCELALFNPLSRTFDLIKDFSSFPNVKKINDSFYYSFTSTGCSDLNWESELFSIDKNKITTLGKMLGTGCENEPFTGIKIYKCNADFDSLINTTTRKPGYYHHKQNFMETYWKKNYPIFKPMEGLYHY